MPERRISFAVAPPLGGRGPRLLSMFAGALLISLLTWAAPCSADPPPEKEAEGDADQYVYPPMPPGQAPPLAVKHSDAETARQMNPYLERISGSGATFEMVAIQGGTLLMGSPDDEPDRNDDEGPRVEVRIEPFWMGRHEVTWAEYWVFMEKLDIQRRDEGLAEPAAQDPWSDAVSRPTPLYDPGATYEKGDDPDHPAVCMTQFAAKVYTLWLSMKTGRYYRLSTEAEWEYACRAGTTTAYYFGDDPENLDEHEWYFDNGDDRYHKVGQKKPNPWGLHDMHGNVAEWVLGQYVDDWYGTIKDRKGMRAFDAVCWPTQDISRLVRGGSWDDDPERLRSAVRRGSEKGWKLRDPNFPKSIWWFTDAHALGFRVIRPLHEPTDEQKKRIWAPDIEKVRKIMLRQRKGER